MHAADSIVVLTTPERCDLFRAAVGNGADLRFDPLQTAPLDTFLVNSRLSGATLCVIDEDHFYSEKDMQTGIDAYVDDPERESSDLRLLLVCSNRRPGDSMLKHYAGYCGIYDIIYGCSGTEITNRLAVMLRRKNRRLDVLDLLRDEREPEEQSQKCQQACEETKSQEQQKKSDEIAIDAELEGLEIKLTIQIGQQKREVSVAIA